MSMIGISIILLIKATYGNYSLAGLVSAVNIIATALVAPTLSRLVDQYGQTKIMVPSLIISVASVSGMLAVALLHAYPGLVCLFAALAGATWGSPSALVRSRWAKTVQRPRQLTTAYAYESAMDEVVYTLGPVLSTVLGTVFHPALGIILIVVFVLIGGIGFFSQRATEPEPSPRPTGHRRSSVIRTPAVIVLALTYVGAGMMFGANDVAVVDFADALGYPAMSGVLLALFSLGSMFAALVYGSRTWQAPMWKLYAIGVFALAIGSSMYLLAHSLPVMAVIMLIAGVACAPTMTNVNMIVARVVPSESLTEGLTWMSTSLNLGLSIGSALAGPAIDTRGSYGGYLFMVVAAWLMVLLMLAGLKIVRNATSGATSTAEVAPVPDESNTPSASGHATQEQDADGQQIGHNGS